MAERGSVSRSTSAFQSATVCSKNYEPGSSRCGSQTRAPFPKSDTTRRRPAALVREHGGAQLQATEPKVQEGVSNHVRPQPLSAWVQGSF